MHPGIELRITTPAGVIVQCDSDWAHFSTIFRGTPLGEWLVLVRQIPGVPVLDEGQFLVEAGAPPALTVEIRAVELEDAPDVPDDARQLMHDAVDVGLAAEAYDNSGLCKCPRAPSCWATAFGPESICEHCRMWCAGHDDGAASGGVRGGAVEGGPGGDR